VDVRGLDERGGHNVPRGHVIRERLSPPDRAQLDPTPTAGLQGTNESLKDFSGESGEAQMKVLKILLPLALPLMNIDVAQKLCHSFCFGAFLIF